MLDFSEKKSYGPIEPGNYELNIELAEFGKTESGVNYISLTFVVRDDVEQDNQGAHVWDTIWENEVFINKATGKTISKSKYDELPSNQKANYSSEMQYSDYKIRTLIQAQDADVEIKDGNGNIIANPDYKTSFADMDEVVLFLNGMNVKAEVGLTMDNNNKEKNTINYKKVTRTENSDDLPF